jgi:hypothetical protein
MGDGRWEMGDWHKIVSSVTSFLTDKENFGFFVEECYLFLR